MLLGPYVVVLKNTHKVCSTRKTFGFLANPLLRCGEQGCLSHWCLTPDWFSVLHVILGVPDEILETDQSFCVCMYARALKGAVNFFNSTSRFV